MAYQLCTNPLEPENNSKPNDTNPNTTDPDPVPQNPDNNNNNGNVGVVTRSESDGISQTTLIAIIVGVCVPIVLIAILVPLIIYCRRKSK